MFDQIILAIDGNRRDNEMKCPEQFCWCYIAPRNYLQLIPVSQIFHITFIDLKQEIIKLFNGDSHSSRTRESHGKTSYSCVTAKRPKSI